jgi:hypothetical protein
MAEIEVNIALKDRPSGQCGRSASHSVVIIAPPSSM